MIAHWDEVEERQVRRGHLHADWRDLGRAAGTRNVGLRRITISPGGWSTPAHVHGSGEEIFYVLHGSGLSWQDGKTYELRPGDAIVHLANREAHTLYGGDEGLDVLAYGTRRQDEATYLPRAGVQWLGHHWVDAGDPEQTPFMREDAVGPPELPEPSPRPHNIINFADVEAGRKDRDGYAGTWVQLGRAAGSVQTGLNHVTVEPSNLSSPPHMHSADEEIFVILAGEGTLELWGADSIPVRPGHVVSRLAGSRVAHAFRAGETDLVLLAYGTREPNDIAYYPRSEKIYFRGVGVMTRLDRLDYWDGE